MFIYKSLPERGNGLAMSAAQAMLPKLGDVLREIPVTAFHEDPEPMECVVVEVHPAHLYYRVRFTATGLHECYKVPKTKRQSWEADQ